MKESIIPMQSDLKWKVGVHNIGADIVCLAYTKDTHYKHKEDGHCCCGGSNVTDGEMCCHKKMMYVFLKKILI